MSLDHPDDIFVVRDYEQVRHLSAKVETLPPWCYTHPDFYQRELQRLFRSLSIRIVGVVFGLADTEFPSTTDIAFEFLDYQFLFSDDRLHEIADGKHAT